MQRKHLIVGIVVAVGAISAAGYGLYSMGMSRGMGMSAGADGAAGSGTQSIAQGEESTRRHITEGIKAGDVDPVTGKRILYYHDPMVPGNKFDKPAKSPFMDMMLVPVYTDGDADQSRVTVSPRIQQNLGLRTAPVIEGMLAPQVAAVGNIAFNERDQVIVQARATAFVERLNVRATLDRVAKGQPLAELYVPDWIAAQEEFLAVRRMQGADLAALADGARLRMRQVGMSEEQIALVESTGKTQPRVTLTAPIGGVVTELMAREGMTVMAGTTLFRINGLATVWANAEVPESQSALLRVGTKVRARSPAAPGTTFDGTVQAIVPEVNPTTRTLKARVELANPGLRLVPGMFVQMQFMDMRAEPALLVPTEAIIQTGKRTLVMLAEDGGRFRPVEVEAGIESGGQTEIKRGLTAGQQIVVSSQFLIDSEASLKGVEARLQSVGVLNDSQNAQPPPLQGALGLAGPSRSGGAKDASRNPTLTPQPLSRQGRGERHEGEARVERIDAEAITLSHGPIPTLQWGPMTMDFKLPAGGVPPGLKAGDRVTFQFTMAADGMPRITQIAPAKGEAATKSTQGSTAGSKR